MAFGKAVAAEAFDLFPTISGKFRVISVCRHAFQEFLTKAVDGPDTLERRHRTPQPVRLARLEARADDGNAHGLLLEQRHAQRLV
jgi:hypothetical protein